MKIISKIPLPLLLSLFCISVSTETGCSAILPNIADYFNVPSNVAQLSSTIYFCGFSCGILSLGRVSDIFGRRKVVLSGLGLYLVSSLFISTVNDIYWLIFLRFFQAFGASVGSVIAQAMARDSYRGHELSYVYATLSIGIAIMPPVSSMMSGYIVEAAGWRVVFAVFGLLSAIMLAVHAKFLPETNPYIGEERIRYLSVLKVVLKDKIVLLYATIVGVFSGMTYSFYIVAPFILIDRVGIAASDYGKCFILFTIASISSGLLNRFLAKKPYFSDHRKLILLGLNFSSLGCISLLISSAFITEASSKLVSALLLFGPMMLHMLGHNLAMPISLRYALEDYAKTTGTAGSIFGALYYILIALVTFGISKINSESTSNYALFFFILNIICSISFYLIKRSHRHQNGHRPDVGRIN